MSVPAPASASGLCRGSRGMYDTTAANRRRIAVTAAIAASVLAVTGLATAGTTARTPPTPRPPNLAELGEPSGSPRAMPLF
ncbi:hypothetical protein NKH77_27980 [Streptomyces sp. M19]